MQNMHTAILHTLLKHLITITNERDEIAAERLLAEVLFDIVASENTDGSQPVVSIYRATNLEKQLFTSVTVGNEAENNSLAPALKQSLTDCFKSGECQTYSQENQPVTKFYPLASPSNRTMAVVAIMSTTSNLQRHETIHMLLQIFQNYTWLNHDNERDTLTGLLNRKSFENKISKVLAHITKTSKRKDDPSKHVYFLAIFDIDHFKNVNDTFGHLIGDEVLLLFSQLMTQTFRDTDMLFRFGGEEFVGVFQCTNPPDIESVLERFRLKISNFNFPQIGKVTASAGYTAISADEISSKLIDRADTALYFAKNNGRNRNCNYEQLIANGSLQENNKEGDIEFF